MIDDGEIDAAEQRLVAATGSAWEVTAGPVPVIAVTLANGREVELRVLRDTEPGSAADVIFVGNSREDLHRLSQALRGGKALSVAELDAIDRRSQEASSGPWRPFLEPDGGIGGTNVIWISDRDNEPDMYLWLGDQLAPASDFELVAAARDDIPRFLAEIRARMDRAGQ